MSADRSPSIERIEALVRRAQRGETAAFEALYDRFYDKVFRYLSFKTGDALLAEDLSEEVFLRMLTSIGSYEHRGHPLFLLAISHSAQSRGRSFSQARTSEDRIARKGVSGRWRVRCRSGQIRANKADHERGQ